MSQEKNEFIESIIGNNPLIKEIVTGVATDSEDPTQKGENDVPVVILITSDDPETSADTDIVFSREDLETLLELLDEEE